MKKFKEEINPHGFSDSTSVAFQNGMRNARNLIVRFMEDWCEKYRGTAFNKPPVTPAHLLEDLKEYLKD